VQIGASEAAGDRGELSKPTLGHVGNQASIKSVNGQACSKKRTLWRRLDRAVLEDNRGKRIAE